jgi:excisionase family DNA binding protein
MNEQKFTNPFEIISERLNTIESLLMGMKKEPENISNKMLSVKELSKNIGATELTIRNWIKEGKIQAKRIGGRIFIEEKQFQNGLQEVKSLKYKR